MQKLGSVLLGVGLLIAVGSVLFGWLAFPAIIKHKVSQQVRLEKDGDTYKKWENIPIPIFMKIYIFNVSNPKEIVKGEKPVVDEIGPYVYQQQRKKINVDIQEADDTIQYQQVITYFFRPDMSNGTEDDPISVINLPFVGMTAKLMKESISTRTVAAMALKEDFPDEPAFLDLTVRDFLFGGYKVDFMETLSALKGGEVLLPNNTFGLYYGKNGTTKEWLSVYSGVKDGTKFGNIATFNNESQLSYWGEFKNDTYCNMINGSDGALFPPFVSRERRLDIFSPELCRSLYLEYNSDVTIKGLKGYRFTLPERVLEDPRKSEENRCFCTNPGDEELSQCPKRGAYQLESCRKGAPIVVSLPHFLDGDPQYQEDVLGLQPERDLHETVITLEPTTGVLLEAKKRIQINIAVAPFKWIKVLKKLPNVLLPVVWVDESAALTDESAERIKSKLIKPQEIVESASWGGFGFGCLLILIAIIIIVVRARNSKTNLKFQQ